MARASTKPSSRKVAVPEAEPVWQAVEDPAAPAATARQPLHEPVWLVRIVIVLFLVGFAAFLAREVARFLETLP